MLRLFYFKCAQLNKEGLKNHKKFQLHNSFAFYNRLKGLIKMNNQFYIFVFIKGLLLFL